MYNEFLNSAFLMHHPDELNDFLPFVFVIYAQSALNRDWNSHLLAHLSTDFCKLLGVEHKDRSKCPISGLLTWTAAVNINLVKAPLLNNLGCLSHFYGVVASKLKNNRVLIRSVVQQAFTATMNYCVLINHFCIQPCMFAEVSHQKSEILV